MVHSIKPPKTIVFGAGGFLGRHFFNYYRLHDPDAIGTSHKREEGCVYFNLETPSFEFLEKVECEYAVIAAAIANPKRCEEDPRRCYQVNVENTLQLAKELNKRSICPILFSTDYVFEGGDKIYQIEDETSALNEYGREKAELEKKAINELEKFCLIRLTKVFSTERGDGSLLDQMVGLILQEKPIFAATDQIFAPIHVNEVVEKVVHIQRERKYGFFQFTGPLEISRFELANLVAEKFNRKDLVRPMQLDALNDGVRRPKRVRLSSSFSFSSIEVYLDDYYLSKGIFHES